ncbi:hypothetical protein [Mycoplasma procyoni]|uniref:hypothetical protein n=1 Tax=Mycoplasma procyoni TaxID=568784 RepID=UPI00197C4D3D|nr:hypothetical protein [Mycoplasma procyoni]MBN3534760.1 hypothetical protein [Mycoplasma procyoni]
MKKTKKLLFALSPIALSTVALASCQKVAKTEQEIEKEKYESEKAKLATKINDSQFLSQAEKTTFTTKLNETKTSTEVEVLNSEVDTTIAQNELNIFFDQIEAQINTFFTRDVAEKSELKNNLTATQRTKEELEKFKATVDQKIKEQKAEVEVEINKLETEAKKQEFTIELNSIENNKKLDELKAKVLEQRNTEFVAKLDEYKAKTTKYIEDNFNKKETIAKLSEEVQSVDSYAKSLEFDKKLKAALKEDIRDTESSRYSLLQEFDIYSTLLANDKKEEFNTRLGQRLEIADRPLNTLVEELKEAARTPQPSDEQVAQFKAKVSELIGTLEESTDAEKKVKSELKTESQKADLTLEEAKALARKVLDQYQKDDKKIRALALVNVNTIERYEPGTKTETLDQLREADTLEKLREVRKVFLARINSHKPSLFTKADGSYDYDKFFRSSAYTSTVVSETNPLEKGATKVRTSYIRSRKEEYRIISDLAPKVERAYKQNEEDIKIKNLLIELKKEVLKAFFEEKPVGTEKELQYKAILFGGTTNLPIRDKISKLLYSIDRAIIDGYFYEEMYKILSGYTVAERASERENYTVYDPKGFRDQKPFWSFRYIKENAEGLKKLS